MNFPNMNNMNVFGQYATVVAPSPVAVGPTAETVTTAEPTPILVTPTGPQITAPEELVRVPEGQVVEPHAYAYEVTPYTAERVSEIIEQTAQLTEEEKQMTLESEDVETATQQLIEEKQKQAIEITGYMVLREEERIPPPSPVPPDEELPPPDDELPPPPFPPEEKPLAPELITAREPIPTLTPMEAALKTGLYVEPTTELRLLLLPGSIEWHSQLTEREIQQALALKGEARAIYERELKEQKARALASRVRELETAIEKEKEPVDEEGIPWWWLLVAAGGAIALTQ